PKPTETCPPTSSSPTASSPPDPPPQRRASPRLDSLGSGDPPSPSGGGSAPFSSRRLTSTVRMTYNCE
ncbi:hypothetical protein EJB05_53625, partial [Eragrostis curvula]